MAIDGNRFIVRLILLGTLTVATLLLLLLSAHDLLTGEGMRNRLWYLIATIVYLLAACLAYKKHHTILAGWMLVSIYFTLTCVMLLVWGLNTPVGILSVAFVIFLVGILFGPKAIIGVSVSATLLLGLTYLLHESGILIPRTEEINTRATTWDVGSYIIIFAIFGLLSWISNTRAEQALQRARAAETSIRQQRNIIRAELEDEYARSRQNKLNEIERLYTFATLGQSTAATLHELSNHLSVLNMDIDDLTQQHKNSKAIVRARESIEHINTMMRHVRRRLSLAQDTAESFSVYDVTKTAMHDVRKKFRQRNVALTVNFSPDTEHALLSGDPLSWSHVITILVTNALEACQDLTQPKVQLDITLENSSLISSVYDNGIGISPTLHKKLFQPIRSEKPNGLGVGLFITKHIIENQFGGTIAYTYVKNGGPKESPFRNGSRFSVIIPLQDTPKNKALHEK